VVAGLSHDNAGRDAIRRILAHRHAGAVVVAAATVAVLEPDRHEPVADGGVDPEPGDGERAVGEPDSAHGRRGPDLDPHPAVADRHRDGDPLTVPTNQPTREDPMATQAQTTQHLDAARQLLDDVMEEAAGDPQAKATAAVAHATLVLAEQVAAVRLVMAADAAGNGAVPAASAQ